MTPFVTIIVGLHVFCHFSSIGQIAGVASLALSAPASRNPRIFRGVSKALEESPGFEISSPSKPADDQRMQPRFAQFDVCATPLTSSLKPLSAAVSLAAWEGTPADAVLHEKPA